MIEALVVMVATLAAVALGAVGVERLVARPARARADRVLDWQEATLRRLTDLQLAAGDVATFTALARMDRAPEPARSVAVNDALVPADWAELFRTGRIGAESVDGIPG